jgi:CubicO group peptidase (beta-lactamase class C family)
MKILKIASIVIGVIVLSIVLSYIFSPDYIKRAIKSGGPRIDDYTFFEHRTVENGTPQPWPVADKYNQYKIDSVIADSFSQNGTVAFLVIKDGKILHEEYWDGHDVESITNPFSVSKGIVGLAIGAALDDGYIKSLDQPASDFIAEFKNQGRGQITIKDLLTMSSGLGVKGSKASMLFLAAQSYYGQNLNKMGDLLQVNEPSGVKFSYQNFNTEVLAIIIKKATGKNLADYVAEKFWKHMGAEHPALWSLDQKDGLEKAYCCFNTTARDIARWGQLILNNGTWNGDTLVSANYVRQSIQPDSFLTDDSGHPVDFYGYHWWIVNFQGHFIPYMRGIVGQYLFVIPDEHAIIVRFGTKHGIGRIGHHPADAFLYLREALRIIDQNN